MLPVGYSMQHVCGDIEIEPGTAELRASYAHTIPAIRAVTAPELRPSRDAGLASLRGAEKHRLANTR